jgi:hypothetical protein
MPTEREAGAAHRRQPLAEIGNKLGKRALAEVATIVKAETIVA